MKDSNLTEKSIQNSDIICDKKYIQFELIEGKLYQPVYSFGS